MKKISKRLLALVLMLGLIASSFGPMVVSAAEDETTIEDKSKGTIKVDEPNPNATYTLYKVFDLDLTGEEPNNQDDLDNRAYVYTASSELEDKLNGSGFSSLISNPKRVNADNNVIIDAEPLREGGELDKFKFAKWLAGLINEENSILELVGEAGPNDTKEWTGLPLGYYMVHSTIGTVVSLDTTDPTAIIHEKNVEAAALELKKEVRIVNGKEEEKTDSDKINNYIYANIGELLEYKITFKFHDYASAEHVLTDVLDPGIDYVTDFKVEAKLGTDDTLTELKVDDGDYTVTPSNNESGENKLTVTFPRDKVVENLRGKEITITYQAKLNNEAEMSNHGPNEDGNPAIKDNKNIVTLIYDQDKYDENKKSGYTDATVNVRTTDFQIHKFADGIDNLEGAEFEIYGSNAEGNGIGEKIEVTQEKNGEELTNTYHVDPNGTGSIKSTNTENITIKGLKKGTYFIKETKAPEGYNNIQGLITLVIDENDNKDAITYTATIEGQSKGKIDGNIVKIENKKGTVLPSTGGMGRTMLYVIGGTIFVASLVLLITKKRMDNTESNK